ncbi:MAG: hypothetical protein ACI9TI_001285 [Natronomonas sp.]|jgi:hypothetical protein|uniref:hypothetical protein n=1 Tax=Natronomonas sp. TaxID=2184060 RepID=UPI003989739B
MRERVLENSRRFWLPLNTNRWLVAAGTSGGVFFVLGIIGPLHPMGTPTPFSQADSIETLSQAPLTSIITRVTLVLTLSQLVLSQELSS